MKRIIILLFILSAASAWGGTEKPQEELHLVYIGNSGITFQQMHRTVETVSARDGFEGPVLIAHPLCRGGSDFGYHVQNLENIRKLVEREGCSIAVITGGNTVVPSDAEKLVSGLQSMGLEVYLFQQAVGEGADRERQRESDDEIAVLAEELDFRVIPLGTAVWDVITCSAGIEDGYRAEDFFAADGSHASKKAAYMGACMIVNMITGKAVVPPPPDYDFTYRGMNSSDEVFLRETAGSYIFGMN